MEPGLELFLFQEEGIRFAAEREGVLIADEVGLRKSMQAIGVINEDPTIRKVRLSCQHANSMAPGNGALARSASFHRCFGVDNGSPHDLFSENVVIINYDRLTQFIRELSACVYDLCVLDECHYTKSVEAKRTRAALSIKARRRIALSGTPILNRPIEIYPVLSWLAPREWPETGRFRFAQRYCGARINQSAGM